MQIFWASSGIIAWNVLYGAGRKSHCQLRWRRGVTRTYTPVTGSGTVSITWLKKLNLKTAGDCSHTGLIQGVSEMLELTLRLSSSCQNKEKSSYKCMSGKE